MHTRIELLIQVLILYSVGTYLVELHVIGPDRSLESHPFFLWSERLVATIFTIEYACRIMTAKQKLKYVFSFYGVIDLIAILPFYLGFLVDMRSLRLVRALRLLRILKFTRYNSALNNVVEAFHNIKKEIQLIGALILFFMIFGSTAILEAERAAQPERFATLGDGLWWSIVTLTTVGYGDAFPITATGRIVAILIIMSGLGIFGTFVSLLGSAFVEAVRLEREQLKTDVALSDRAVEVLRAYQESLDMPVDRTTLNQMADQLVIAGVDRLTRK